MEKQLWFSFVKCECPRECDCENPPPDDGHESGIYHLSNECPVHNLFPGPNPECPLHGDMTAIEFAVSDS